MAVKGDNSLSFKASLDNRDLSKGVQEALRLIEKLRNAGSNIEIKPTIDKTNLDKEAKKVDEVVNKIDSSDPVITPEIDNDALGKDADESVGIIGELSDRIKRINPFMVLATGASVAFAAIARDAYKMMSDFETSMNEVKTIANVSEAEFKSLERQVFSLYKQLGTETASELATGLYDIIGAGYEAADALHLLEVSSKAATAGVTTSAVASDGLTTILNAFRLEVEDATRVADIMFATVDIGKISFEELSTQIAQVAPLAAASGFSFEEIGAAISTLTKQGVPASQAMTQIRAALISTNEVMGDGIAETTTLQNAFQAMYDKAGGSQNELKELVGRIEAVNGILGLAGPNMEGAAQDLLHMADAAGSVNRSFDMVTDGAAKQWDIFTERVRSRTEELGSVMLEMSGSVARALNNAMAPTQELTENFEAQKLELFKLEGALHQVTEGSKEFNDIRDIILKNYPKFIGEIDAEKASTQQLLTVLDKVNDAYVQRYKYARREQELMDAMQRQGDIEISIEDASDEFGRAIAEIRAKYPSIELDLSLSDEDLYDQVNEQTRQLRGLTGQRTEGQQVLAGQVMRLKDLIVTQQEYREELEEQKRIVDEIAEQNKRFSQADLKTKAGQLEAIAKINAAMKETELSQFLGSGVDEIEKAVQARLSILSQFSEITATDNLDGLTRFLESENEEIAKFAKERYRILNTDYEPGGGQPDDVSFTEILKDRENRYKEYTAVMNQLGKEVADEQFKDLLKQGENYGQFLQNQLDKTTDAAKQTAIAVAAELNKITLNRGDVSTVSSLTPMGAVDMDVNDTSINYIRGQIQLYTDELNAAKAADRPDIQERLDYWNQRLEAARAGLESEKALHANFVRTLSDMTMLELRQEKQKWKEIVNTAKAGTKEEREAKSMLGSVGLEIGNRTSDSIKEVSDSLSEASAMFRRFGEEDLANVIDKLSAVGGSVANIAEGISMGGPLGAISVISGVFGALGNLFGGGNTPKESEFEKAIKRLTKSVDDLNHSLYNMYGQEAMSMRSKTIESMGRDLDALRKKQEALKKAQEGFESQDNFLSDATGSVLGEIYEGRQKELEEATEELRRLQEEYNELITGTTSQSITDSIIQGIREGKKGIQDFADTFEETMQEALLRTVQTYYLEGKMAEFYDQFTQLGIEGDGYSAADIAELQGMWGKIMNELNQEVETMNKILEESGFDPLGSEASRQRQGLAGSISSITEDTANILAGTLNAMRLDIRQGLDIAIESSQYLGEIASNTRYNRFLESIDNRLGTMERGFQEFQAQG